jgi:putative N6-adenine-specific DNA methylase
MIAKNIAPGIERDFAFQQLKNYQADLREEVIRDAKSKQFQGSYQLLGSDRDAQVLAYAKENAERAGVADCISFTEASFPDPIYKWDANWLLTNPPYGKRLSSEEDLAPLYHQLASFWAEKSHFGGVITSFPFFEPTFSHKSLYN